VFVPALTGLGSPHWDPYARGTIVGLTRGATRAHLVAATLEAIAFQTLDAVRAMDATADEPLRELRADGGASVNGWLMQFQADVLGVPSSCRRCPRRRRSAPRSWPASAPACSARARSATSTASACGTSR
jgi:glycerol kinase